MFARVIVDVPTKETDRPYEYRVPESMQNWIEIGSRVGVPFGQRRVQGFVVDLLPESEWDQGKLRDIEQILDLHPPLNQELVQLADWMSNYYLCNKITALQAMLPGALKAKYRRYITCHIADQPNVILSPEEEQMLAFIQSQQQVELDTLLKRFPSSGSIIKELVQKGILSEVQTIQNRLSTKKVFTVYPPEDLALLNTYMDELPANAVRQKEVLAYLSAHPEPIRLSDLLTRLQVSASTVKSLAKKQWIAIKEEEVYRDPYADHTFILTKPHALTPEQNHVFRFIIEALQDRKHQPFLLHGVTGSGKTEIYLQAIQTCLEQGREAIVLVPEISLTPQMVERFKSRFGDQVAVMHSRLSQGERYDEWRKVLLKQVKVVIGARSAIFAPFTRLGLIILDEEHESSYKQEESPKYHARDIALKRGAYHQAVVIMGSATPSLESYHQAVVTNKMKLLKMTSRVEGRPMPEVTTIDMREELRQGNRSMFSRALYAAIEDRLAKNEQMILMLNRRGHSTFILCRSCGYVLRCPHCDISLTYHRQSRNVRCHYCGYAEREPDTCPDCQSEYIRFFGTGTQRVEEELSKWFPGIRIIRMDIDTTSQKGAHEKWLSQFREGRADVLLGTQMVAKGLDFPNVTLVGVIAADTVLNLPDFRAAEKTFQLLTQVAGRAGRHHLSGEVFVQTYYPEHYSVICAGKHDYEAFVQRELWLRKQRMYPPYCKLVLITFSHEQPGLLVQTGEKVARFLREQRLWKDAPSGGRATPWMEVLGPVASPIPKIKDRYRFQCMIKYGGETEVTALIKQAVTHVQDVVKQHNIQLSIDVDPQFMM